MTNNTTTAAQAAITQARNEIAQEKLSKAVALLKTKLREEAAAETVLANVRREIAELQLKIEQGNI
jgi:hypothetical protein